MAASAKFLLLDRKNLAEAITYSDVVGLGGLEPSTSSLSVTRSNQLSYSPKSSKGASWWSENRPKPDSPHTGCCIK